LLKSDAHLRHLVNLTDGEQDEVLELVESWAKLAGLTEWSPKLIKAAKTFLHPPETARDPEDSMRSKLVRQFAGLVKKTLAEMPDKTEKVILEKIDGLAEKALALGRPPRTTGIDWTEATWNPLQGCTRASSGCDFCYAAKWMATRRADAYPGLAKEVTVDGRKAYAFCGKIVLLPDHLAVPLDDRTPKRYFVNSMSDLFHKDVPDQFIDAVFTVMEKTSWHQFQVLTKRPERMADFTEKRYKDVAPPANVWLGTSTENQEAYDERRPHLGKTKAAVRWLSVEPMLGPIDFGSLDGIDWVVVGGESGSDRRMEKIWVTGVRDQCAESKVPFFFKQWGEFDEAGQKMKGKPKKDGLGPVAKLDGVVHDAYPDHAELVLAE
jgi:protein gp37